MTDATSTPAPFWRRVASFVAVTVIFGLAHTQAPLYYSNQHQYFLHGLARAGMGELRSDWLANTADPTPLFSRLVEFTHRYLNDALFHVYFFLLLGLYANSLVGIFRHLTGLEWSSRSGLAFLTVLTLAHAGALRLASAHLLGQDYPWYLQAGVAGQYVLGPGLQPSVFGVLLLAAVYAFLSGRDWFAMVSLGLAADAHSTYLPTAAFLTLAFMIEMWRREGARQALLLGATALVLVLPVVVYDLRKFAPDDAGVFAEAQRIIAHDRIPHHAQLALWFNPSAAVQYIWIILAIVLARGTRLLPLMLIPLVLSAVLTLVQVATGSDTLALLFPWRTTAILVPLATAVMIWRIAVYVPPSRLVSGICSAGLIALAAGGVIIMAGGFAYRTNQDELPLLEYIRANKREGDLYLIPVEIPKPRAAGSTSFTPPPRREQQQGLISVDLQRFRLYTGAPIYVDFKSIPYKDREVIEWWDRLRLVKLLYEHPELSSTRITHVVAPVNKPLRGAGEIVYQDAWYILYRVTSSSDAR